MIRLFGLKNCDTCRKALKELSAAGRETAFIDIRAEAGEADIDRWLAGAGAAALINRRSATWRGLSAAEREAAEGAGARGALIAHPALIKRPVIEAGGALFIGWDAAARAALL
ncbi:ArsC/Spx/MgsR family protein [Pikeienuella sp. HZG-20]|uniref:ArsC/Spx/MgsR family protein n=1 Tax=Paludibacillus litoralis TaxID=3133267 RepID=UPI0030EC9978